MRLNKEAVSRFDVETMVHIMHEAASFGNALYSTSDETTQRRLTSMCGVANAMGYLQRTQDASPWAVGSARLDTARRVVHEYKDKNFIDNPLSNWGRFDRDALFTGLLLIPAITDAEDIGPCTAIWCSGMARWAEYQNADVDTTFKQFAQAFIRLDATEIDQSFTHLIKRT
jgi:hypothetical protein